MEDYECPYCEFDCRYEIDWFELCETGAGETEVMCPKCGKTFELVWETVLDTFTRTLEERDRDIERAQRMVEEALSKAKLKER